MHSAEHKDDVLDIGSRRELFVDELLIDRMEGATLRLQEPRPGGVAIERDRSWEGPQAFFYATVLKDGDVYRMYYRSSAMGSATCYAESADGTSWTKPELGLLELEGSKGNNAIVPGRPAYQFCPFVDTRPGVAAEDRYKAVARDASRPYQGLIAYLSGDGVHWRRLREEPIVPFALENNFDSQNVAFWSETEGRYVAYMRHMVGGRRSTSRATSEDFLNWSEQTPMSYSDTGSTTPSQHLYTNQTQPYFRAPHIYISMPGRMHFGRRLLSADEADLYTQLDARAGRRRRRVRRGAAYDPRPRHPIRLHLQRKLRKAALSGARTGRLGATIRRMASSRRDRPRCPCTSMASTARTLPTWTG